MRRWVGVTFDTFHGMWIVALACVVVIDGKLGKRTSSELEINKFCLFAASPFDINLGDVDVENLGKYQVSSIN